MWAAWQTSDEFYGRSLSRCFWSSGVLQLHCENRHKNTFQSSTDGCSAEGRRNAEGGENMELLELAAALAVISLAYVAVLITQLQSRLRHLREIGVNGPPKPDSLLLGNLPDYKTAVADGKLKELLSKWCTEWGDTYCIRFAHKPLIFTSNPEAVRLGLQSRPQKFGRAELIETVLFDMLHTSGLFSANGENWKKYRRLGSSALNTVQVKRMLPAVADTIQRLNAKWAVHPVVKNGDDNAVRQDLLRMSFEIGCRVVFGYDPKAVESQSDFVDHVHVIFESIQKRLTIPIPYWKLPLASYVFPDVRSTSNSVSAVTTFLSELIRKYRLGSNGDSKDSIPTNLLEALVQATTKDTGRGMLSEAELIGNATQFLLASEDTTAHTIEWVLFHLAQFPEWQERVYDELCSIFDAPEALYNAEVWSQPSFASQFRTLNCIIKESARLRPIVPMLILGTHEAVELPTRDVRSGVEKTLTIPKDQDIAFLLREVAFSPSFFSRPREFIPERWDDDWRTQKFGEDFVHDGSASRPFGAGPRVCIGMHLATLEVLMCVSSLVRTFDISFDENVLGDTPIDSYDPGETKSFSSFPRVLPLVLTRR